MARGVGVAAAVAVVLTACAPGSTGEQQADVPEALAADDECVAGGEQCALSTLQLRGARLAAEGPEGVAPTQVEALSGVDAGKRRKEKKKDISAEQAEDFEEDLVQLVKDIDKMEKKVMFYNWDIDNMNGTMLSVPGATINVNGTRVMWTSHGPDWYPVFSLASQKTFTHRNSDHPELPQAELDPDDDEPQFIEYDEDDEDSEEQQPFETQSEAGTEVGKRKKKGKKKSKKVKKINLHRKVKAEMMYQQRRLRSFTPSFARVSSRIAWMNDYMTQYTHIFQGPNGTRKPVLMQRPQGLRPDDVLDAPPRLSGGKKDTKKMTCTGKGKKRKCVPKKKPEDDLSAGIGGAQSMVRFIWDSIGTMDLEMETTKQRIELYVYGMTTAAPWGPWTVHSSTSSSTTATTTTA